MGRPFDAVGFDMDGTFLKTRVNYDKLRAVDKEVAERRKIPWDEIDFGPSPIRLRTPIRDWLEAHGRGEEWPSVYDELDTVSTQYECEFVAEATPFPGAVECLRNLKSHGYRVGILTRGSREYAFRALGPLCCEFDFIMGRDYSDFEDAKPSPVAMRQFASEMKVSPDRLLYVGDNYTDRDSAVGAGVTFIGVLTGACTREDWMRIDSGMRVTDSVADIFEIVENWKE